MANFNLIPAVVIWAVLAIATLGLALYRKFVSAGETDLVHLGPKADSEIPEQMALAAKLDSIDHWGKILTLFTVASGLPLVALYLYQTWLAQQ